MAFYKIVVREVQRNRCFKILTLFAESVGKAGQSAHVQARRAIQSLYVARGSPRHIWKAGDSLLVRYDDLRGAKSALGHNRIISDISLDDLSEIYVRTKG